MIFIYQMLSLDLGYEWGPMELLSLKNMHNAKNISVILFLVM